MMNIAIIGYGKMGKIIEQLAREQGHGIAAIVDPFASGTSILSGVKISKSITEAEGIDRANAAIEFTQPSTAAANVIALAEKKIPTVSGTTGWHEQMSEVKAAIEANQSALLWSSNFSIGVNLFYRIAWYAAALMNEFPEFDVGGFEAHHNRKIDSPSGTAKILAEGVVNRIKRKNTVVWETLNRRPEADELHFPSLRVGSVTGRHSLFFDSAADTIEITHTARNREGFASGAIRAAVWLSESKRQGVFTLDDMLDDIGIKEQI
ncbi:MAG: 4-hydroxy-tetrahydrodipicolinate reductase [Treponema sp.]|jgi:4-hydroxy-tetrahydrodipicolinate reductase|nr:4-hydroxy-tetrahydrodipicolinate reductase [Treponema sp.]